MIQCVIQKQKERARMAEMVKCENCVYMYRCERTYLGECDCGVAWGNAHIVEIGAVNGKGQDGDEA